MDLFSHLNEIKLIATLALGFFCYRKLQSVTRVLDEDLHLSDSQDTQRCDEGELQLVHQTQLDQSLKIEASDSTHLHEKELSEVTPNSPKSLSQTFERQDQIQEQSVEIQKYKPIRKNKVRIIQRSRKLRMQRHRKLRKFVVTSEACQIVQ